MTEQLFNIIYRDMLPSGTMRHSWFVGWHGDTSDRQRYAETFHADRAFAGVFTADEVAEHQRLFDVLHPRRSKVGNEEERMALIPVPVGIMSALELRQAQRRLGLSDAELAASIECSEQHVRRMKVIDPSLSSHRAVGASYAKLIKAMLDGKIEPVRKSD